MADGENADFNLYRALWESINDIVIPSPPSDKQQKACLLLESPGFSISPDEYDFKNYHGKFQSDTQSSRSDPSPEYRVAQLCDRIPSIADYFYDTGEHISFKWQQLLSTFWLNYRPSEDEQLRGRYEKAIAKLYVDYERQEKTELYRRVDDLRQKWEEALERKKEFYEECVKDEDKGPQYFASNAGPKIESVRAALSEYEQLKREVQNDQAVIYEYTCGDIGIVIENAFVSMKEHQRNECGSGGSGAEYYETTLDPSDWYTWFKGEDAVDENGWTSVTISSKSEQKSSKSSFSALSATASASYGLFSTSVGHSSSQGQSKTNADATDLTIAFKLRKVKINRPWLERSILDYPIIGMRQVPKHEWSDGTLDKRNKGSFPLLPIAMIVARDVKIRNFEMSAEQKEQYKKSKTEASLSCSFGCFGFKGSGSYESGSGESSSSYNEDLKELSIKGSQIIGWVCTVMPAFPAVEKR